VVTVLRVLSAVNAVKVAVAVLLVTVVQHLPVSVVLQAVRRVVLQTHNLIFASANNR
jgi:hypothetical protein